MSEMTYRDALNLALREEMRRDPSVVVFGEDVALYEGSFKVTRGLLAEFGEERIRDTPISENTIIGVAIGAAMGGLRPVAELMTAHSPSSTLPLASRLIPCPLNLSSAHSPS